MQKRAFAAAWAAVAAALLVTAPAWARHGPPNHIPPSQANVDLVGQVQVKDVAAEEVADVATYRDTAYLAGWSPMCQLARTNFAGGFWSIDISNPRNPVEVGFTPMVRGSYLTEGMQAMRLTTATFTGDVMIASREICGNAPAGQGKGGFVIYDVSNPAAPVLLGEGGDPDVRGPLFNSSHSSFAWDTGDKAYVAIVDNQEFEDIDIFDITDPRNPRLIRETGLDEWPTAQDNLAFGEQAFVHDLIVRRVEGDWMMLASYWDAGYVVLNINDPANPVFVKDSDFPATDPLTGVSPPEGNAHEAEWDRCPEEGVRSRFPCGDVRYILAADEDFSPYRTGEFRITTGPNAGLFPSVPVGGAAAVAILPDRKLNGPVVYGGYACPPPESPPVPQRSAYNLGLAPGEEAILVVQRGPGGTPTAPHDPEDPPLEAGGCFPGNKAEQAIEAGWDAVVFVQRHGGAEDPPFCGSGDFPPEPPIVGVCTNHEAYHKMFNTAPDFSIPYVPAREPDLGQIGQRVQVDAIFDGWGYLHLLNADTMEHIDAYAVPQALDPRFATGFGDLTIHEITTDPTGDVGYIAWYSAGFRVVDYSGGTLEEVGHYVDPAGSDIWGVELNVRRDGRLFALASDRSFGLQIFRFGTDLRPVKASSPRITTVGRTFSYTLRVANTGTIAETNTVVRDRLPRGVRFVSASATQGRCSYRASTRTVTCNLGRLANDAGAAFVSITVRATRAGTIRNTAVVGGRKAEYDIGNNRARATTRVRRAPAPPPVLTGRP